MKVSLHCLHQRLGLDKRGGRKTGIKEKIGNKETYHFKEKIRNKETIRNKEMIKNKETYHFKEDFLDKALHLVGGHRHQRDEVPEHVRVLQVRHLGKLSITFLQSIF